MLCARARTPQHCVCVTDAQTGLRCLPQPRKAATPQASAHLMRFFDVMRGTRMAAPSRLLPVMKMPLHSGSGVKRTRGALACRGDRRSRARRAGERGQPAAIEPRAGAPCGAGDGQADRQADAQARKEVGRNQLEQEAQVGPVDEHAGAQHVAKVQQLLGCHGCRGARANLGHAPRARPPRSGAGLGKCARAPVSPHVRTRWCAGDTHVSASRDRAREVACCTTDEGAA